MSKSQNKFMDDVRANKPKRVFKFKKIADLVKAMNKLCGVCPRGDKIKIAVWGRDKFRFLSEHDAKLKFAQFMHVTPDDVHSGFPIWVQDEKRREFSRAVFNPGLPKFDPNDESMPDELNLWSGFAVAPKPGDWSLMKAHLLNNVCQGDKDRFDYLMQWLSQMFCEPERKSGVCIALRGEPGVGKSKLGEWLCFIVGPRHARTIDKPHHIHGQFNSLIEQAIFVLVEEASFADDPKAQGQLNHIITNLSLVLEGKGVDAEQGENYSRFLIVTNKDWAAPVSARDRRYAIYDVGADHKEDKPYFIAIDEQMENGGAEAMLHDLLAMNVKMRDMPKPPMTEAKHEQIVLGMKPDVEWLYEVLNTGEFPLLDPERTIRAWPDDGGAVAKDDVFASFRDFVSGKAGRSVTPIKVGLFLKKWIPNLETTRPNITGLGRVWSYSLPPLAGAREAFLKAYPTFEFDELESPKKTTDANPSPESDTRAGMATPSSVTKLDAYKQARA